MVFPIHCQGAPVPTAEVPRQVAADLVAAILLRTVAVVIRGLLGLVVTEVAMVEVLVTIHHRRTILILVQMRTDHHPQVTPVLWPRCYVRVGLIERQMRSN